MIVEGLQKFLFFISIKFVRSVTIFDYGFYNKDFTISITSSETL